MASRRPAIIADAVKSAVSRAARRRKFLKRGIGSPDASSNRDWEAIWMSTSITTTAVHEKRTNVSNKERLASVLAGGALVAYGLQRGSWRGVGFATLGGALAVRGITGHCGFY